MRGWRERLARWVFISTLTSVKVTFDPVRDAISRLKHGLGLADFDGFDSVATVELDDRFDYGEVRFRAFGKIAGSGYAIAYTEIAEGIRLISFRRAHEKEMRRYE